MKFRRSRWPLFLRIFVLMLVTVLLVQTINFALVLLMPPPTPAVHSAVRIAAALRTGKDGSGTLRVTEESEEPPARNGPRELRLATKVASLLSIPVEAVRAQNFGPMPPGLISPFDGPGRRLESGRREFFPAALSAGELVFGPFVVSVRTADGRWRSVRPIAGGFEPWRWRALLWLLVAMLVVAPFAWILARRLVKPIGLFAAAAERLGRDPHAQPLKLGGPPELAEAAAAFNEMQARLNRYVEDRTTLVAAIAHDLRTPLMRLGMRLENAPTELRLATEGDIREMDQRISAVMGFVRDMTGPARRQKLDLRSLAESLADDAADRGQAVTLVPGFPIILSGDAPALKALLANLIGNAVNYAGHAEIYLWSEGEEALIEVRDSGPGMAPLDLDQAFEPFFRGERSRSRDTGGIGLGLASVRAVARAHGGEASVANRVEGGLVARVALPL